MPPETASGTPSATQQQGPTLEDAAAAFAGMLDAETATPAAQGPQSSPDPAQAEAFEGTEVEASEGDEPQAETGETSAEGEPLAETDEQADEPAQSTTPVYTVRVNGKQHQVTLDEALKGYSRTADYNAKTQSLAEARKGFEQERAQLLAERQQYAALLPALVQQLEGQGPEPDWEALYKANPLDYVRQKDLWRERQDRIAAARYEQQRLQESQRSETEATRLELMKKGREYLQQKVPAWAKDTVWEADRAKLVAYARKADYSDQEIANALDPRAILMMDKARRYDELMANKPRPVTNRAGPRVSTAGQPGVQQSESQRAAQRLARTGRLEDAAAVFRGLLG